VNSENRQPLIAADEGKILFSAMLLLALYIGVTVFCGIFFPDFYEIIIAVTASNIVVGRVPGISVAYAMEGSFYTAVGITFAIETMLVLFIYPLFIMSWNKLLDNRILKKWSARMRRNAEEYRPLIRKYGMIGLFGFVWFPFWMTGPIIGSIIGYLMGFRHRVTLSIVLTGTLIAISCWGLALRHLHEWAFALDPRAPWFIVALMALLVMIAFIIGKFSQR
jgi:uncharacterized membrane protein